MTAPNDTTTPASPAAEPSKAVTVAGSDRPRPLANADVGTFATEANFALAQRAATALAASALVPEAYRNNAPNCLIALDIAYHQRVSPLTVMQNLHIIHGRPSWGSSYVIGALNSCGRFSPIRFKMERNGKKKVEVTTWTGQRGNRTPSKGMVEIEDWTCYAYATELATGERVEGPTVSLEMATVEGWTAKAESKWLTMPDLMLRYRAAAFFGRLYAPDILMGMQTAEEVFDVGERPAKVTATARASAGASALQEALETATADAKPADAVGSDAPKPDAQPEPMPEPGDYVRRAMEKDAAGEPISRQEMQAIDEYNLELDEWRARAGSAA